MQNYQVQLDKVVEISRKLLTAEPATIFEMGANDCNDTLAFNRFFPAAKIYAFECNPDTLPTCREKVKGLANIILTEKAVSDKEGTLSFYKTVGDGSQGGDVNHGASSVFESNEAIGGYKQQQVKVPATTIEKVAKEYGIGSIDLLWMDMQGSELSALKGAGEFLKNIKIINTEVEFFMEYKNQPLFKDVKKFLNDNGFRLYTFSGMCKVMGDAVFINTRTIKKGFLLPEWMIIAYFRLHEKVTGKIRKIKNDLTKR